MHSQIIERLKASGIFDQFRKECIADVDTKSAYINLHSRVVQQVDDYLKNVHWSSKLVRFNVREGMRKQIMDSSYFQKGVDRIVNQTVDPKINPAFFPVIENAVYEFLGVQKPKEKLEQIETEEEDQKCWEQPMDIDPPTDSCHYEEDLKPTQEELKVEEVDSNIYRPEEAYSPTQEIKTEDDEMTGDLVIAEQQAPEEKMEEEDDEEESPPFEAIGFVSPPHPIPVPASAVVVDEASSSKPVDNTSEDIQKTDFSNCFAKPPEKECLLSTDSSDVGENVFIQNIPEKKETSSKSSSTKDTSKERSTSSGSKKSSEKEKSSTSSTRDKGSSSHSHSSKSKSKHRDHSRDKEKTHSDKDKGDRDRDKGKKESTSSSKYSSKSSDSKYRSSHSSSSHRHSSTSRSKESGRSSDKGKSDEKSSSSKYSHKDSKEHKSSSSSHEKSSRSHSSSSKTHDKNKHSSSSKRSSSRHDSKSSKSKSSSKTQRDKQNSQKSGDESSHKAKSGTSSGEDDIAKHVNAQPQPQPAENLPAVSEQMSPDVNEEGMTDLVVNNFPYHPTSPPKMEINHEETAMDRWYSSDTKSRSDGQKLSFSNSNLGLQSVKRPFQDEVEVISSNSSVSEKDDNSNSYAYSPVVPMKPESQIIDAAETPEIELVHDTRDRRLLRKQAHEELICSLRDLTKAEEFVVKREYLSKFLDPFYDERSVPVSPASVRDVSKHHITIENCRVNENMIKWLEREGACVYLKKHRSTW